MGKGGKEEVEEVEVMEEVVHCFDVLSSVFRCAPYALML